jgi:hypothetical protein
MAVDAALGHGTPVGRPLMERERKHDLLVDLAHDVAGGRGRLLLFV